MWHKCGSSGLGVLDGSPGGGCQVSMSLWLSKEPGPRGSGAPCGLPGVAQALVRDRREALMLRGVRSREALGQPSLLGESRLSPVRGGDASFPAGASLPWASAGLA